MKPSVPHASPTCQINQEEVGHLSTHRSLWRLGGVRFEQVATLVEGMFGDRF